LVVLCSLNGITQGAVGIAQFTKEFCAAAAVWVITLAEFSISRLDLVSRGVWADVEEFVES
jgi:hypothetical protein